MGRKEGHRQITLFMQRELYERVRHSAYILGEDIYVFLAKAATVAMDARLTAAQKAAIEAMSKQHRPVSSASRAKARAL